MSAPRSPLFSSSAMPLMVVPAGEATLSFSTPGCVMLPSGDASKICKYQTNCKKLFYKRAGHVSHMPLWNIDRKTLLCLLQSANMRCHRKHAPSSNGEAGESLQHASNIFNAAARPSTTTPLQMTESYNFGPWVNNHTQRHIREHNSKRSSPRGET